MYITFKYSLKMIIFKVETFVIIVFIVINLCLLNLNCISTINRLDLSLWNFSEWISIKIVQLFSKFLLFSRENGIIPIKIYFEKFYNTCYNTCYNIFFNLLFSVFYFILILFNFSFE